MDNVLVIGRSHAQPYKYKGSIFNGQLFLLGIRVILPKISIFLIYDKVTPKNNQQKYKSLL